MLERAFRRIVTWMAPLLITAGCATPSVSNFTATGAFAEMAAGPTSGIAQPGDILFTQKVVSTQVARLTTGAEFRTDGNKAAVYVLNAGDLLFAGIEEGSTARVFCSFEPNFLSTSAFGDSNYQSCLSDENGDGRFDTIGGFVGVVGPEVPIRAGQIVAKTLIPADIRYETAPLADSPATLIGVRYEHKLFGKPRLVTVPITRASEQARWFFKQKFAELPASNSLPAILDVGGAKIEILGEEAGALRYRIASGFPEGDAFDFVFDPLPYDN